MGDAQHGARAIVVFGVAGVGKTSVAERLAQRTGARFVDADDYHDADRIAMMSAGIPLQDEDRWEWLALLQGVIREALDRGESIVLACSALKKAYRDVLREGGVDVFVQLDLPRPQLERRIAERTAHFMPASMLSSQLAAFEPLSPEECAMGAFAVSAAESVDAVVERIAAQLGGVVSR